MPHAHHPSPRLAAPGDPAGRAAAGPGLLALAAGIAFQLAAAGISGMSVVLVLPVAWLAARVSLSAGLAAGAAAVASATLRPVLHGDGLDPVVGILIRAAAFTVIALVAGRTTARLRAGNELLHGILEGTSDAITVKDVDGRYLLVNEPAAALLCAEPAAVIGRTDAELLAPDLAEPRRSSDAAVVATGRPRRYWRTASHGGVERTHSVVKVPYRDGDGAVRGVVTVSRDETEREAMARALAASENRYRTLVHNLPGASVMTFDHDLRFSFAAGEALAAVGTETDIVGRTLAEVLPSVADRLEPRYRATLAGEPQTFELDGRGGIVYWVQMTPLRDGDGLITGGMVLAQDITDRRAVEREVAQAEGRFRSAFDQAPIGMALISLDGRYLRVNDALCAITGRPAGELLRSSVEALTHPDDRAADHEGRRALADGRVDVHRIEKRYLHADGHPVWVDVHNSLVRDADGDPIHVLGQVQDITERRRFERRLQHLADHDSLTGLLNRRRFEAELARHVSEVDRYGAQGAVLVLDVDDFKLVNDSLGHSAGDALLQTVAGILRANLRASDIVARLGGDEFAVLLPRGGAAEAEAVAAKIVRAVREGASVAVGEAAQGVTTSIGVAAFDGRLATGAEMLVHADLAMYAAKAAGRDGFARDGRDGFARHRSSAGSGIPATR